MLNSFSPYITKDALRLTLVNMGVSPVLLDSLVEKGWETCCNLKDKEWEGAGTEFSPMSRYWDEVRDIMGWDKDEKLRA